MHTDDSEITLNVSLNRNFTGCALRFCGLSPTSALMRHSLDFEHARGRGVIHPGLLRHAGASAGRGICLIIFFGWGSH